MYVSAWAFRATSLAMDGETPVVYTWFMLSIISNRGYYLNWFQRGISSLIINGLGNSSELAVLDDHTMFEVIESMNQVYTAGISPSIAKEVAKK